MTTDESWPVRSCVGCAFCCNQAPCLLAVINGWQVVGEPCSKLYHNGERYRCRAVEEREEWAGMLFAGEGCCSPLNTERRKYHVKSHSQA